MSPRHNSRNAGKKDFFSSFFSNKGSIYIGAVMDVGSREYLDF